MKLLNLPMLLSGIALLSTPVFAAKDKSTGQKSASTEKNERSSEQSQMKQVSGTITQIKEVEVRGANTKNTIVMLKTNKNNRRLVVDLGPTKALKASSLKVGSEIQVEGAPAQVREHRFLVASRFKANGKNMTVDRKLQESQHRKAADTEKETS